MSFIAYLVFRFFVLIFKFLPFSALYKLSDGVAWLFYRVIRYRYKVVTTNLLNAFPEKTPAEIEAIIKKSYLNVSDLLVESMKGFSIDEATLRERYVFKNLELMEKYWAQGHSIIFVAAHYANWEWGALSFGLHFPGETVGLYKPLSNPYMEKYAKASRGKFGTHLIDIGRTARAFEERAAQQAHYIMVSDQSTWSKKAHWVHFLNQDTACVYGADKYSRSLGYPVIFLDIQRKKRGFYEVELELLTDRPQDLPEMAVTQMFMAHLEKILHKKPEDWLWSHKRWKNKRVPNLT